MTKRMSVDQRLERLGTQLAKVEDLEAALEEAERGLRRAVQFARAGGASWADIGSELGVSKQAAWERYAEGQDL